MKRKKQKNKELSLKFNQIFWLLSKKLENSFCSLNIYIYNTTIKPIWIYEYYRCGVSTTIKIIQRFQSEVSRSLINSFCWCVCNDILSRDLNVSQLKSVIRETVTLKSTNWVTILVYWTINLLDQSAEKLNDY